MLEKMTQMTKSPSTVVSGLSAKVKIFARVGDSARESTITHCLNLIIGRCEGLVDMLPHWDGTNAIVSPV